MAHIHTHSGKHALTKKKKSLQRKAKNKTILRKYFQQKTTAKGYLLLVSRFKIKSKQKVTTYMLIRLRKKLLPLTHLKRLHPPTPAMQLLHYYLYLDLLGYFILAQIFLSFAYPGTKAQLSCPSSCILHPSTPSLRECVFS